MLLHRFCLPAAFAGAVLSTASIAHEGVAPRPYEGHALVRVEMGSPEQVRLMESLDLDCWCEGLGIGTRDFRVPPARMEALRRTGLRFEVVDGDLQARVDAEAARITEHNRQDGGDWYAEYKDLDQILAHIDELIAAHPDLAERIDVGDTIEGRDIWAVRVTAGEGDKPAILYNSCQHAREWISPMTTMFILESLLTGYGQDDRITALVNGTEFFIVPVVNPDGYRYSWDTFRFWRKNRRDNGGGSFGVDLNRNWGVGWGGDGSSGNPDSPLYRGTAPFSEPETQSMRDFYEAQPNLTASIDFHSQGELVLFPYAYQPGGPGDGGTHANTAEAMSDAIFVVHGRDYEDTPVYERIGPASGGGIDWTWDEQDVISMAIELRGPGFDPPPSTIRPNAEENLAGALAMAERHGRLGLEGDVDGDGFVTFADLLMVLAAWGPCEDCPEDVDGNGIVDFDDLLIVLANWS